MPANTVIKLRRGTQAQWSSVNPVLAAGELGIETDTVSFKFGDGTLAWADLPYAGGSEFTGSVDWINVLNKPTEFTPEPHTHTKSEIIDFVDLGYGDVDGGSADAWYTWMDLKIDNSDANAVILDGVYVDGGRAVL